jgi:hypothetical protein
LFLDARKEIDTSSPGDTGIQECLVEESLVDFRDERTRTDAKDFHNVITSDRKLVPEHSHMVFTLGHLLHKTVILVRDAVFLGMRHIVTINDSHQ